MITASDVGLLEFEFETLKENHDIQKIWDECEKRVRVEIWDGELVNGIELRTHPERAIRTKLKAAEDAGGYVVKGFIDEKLAFLQYDNPETSEIMTDKDYAMEDMKHFITKMLVIPIVEQLIEGK